MRFTELEVKYEIIKATEDLGYVDLMEIQERVIPYILDGFDVIGQAKTGTGKTAAFGIPLIEMSSKENEHIEHLIITPTRELAIQIEGELKKLGKYLGIKVCLICGGQDYFIERKGIKTVPNIVVGTPGRLVDHIVNNKIDLSHLKTLTLDEADEMLSFGFKDELDQILAAKNDSTQSLLFSATMPKGVKALADKMLKNPVEILVSSGLESTENVKQYAIFVDEEKKFNLLTKFLEVHHPKKAIIFGRTKRRADELSHALNKCGILCRALHGDLTQKERTNVMMGFRNGVFPILVATDVASRGLDINDVEVVYNFDLPQEIEYYVHRIGRTGRALKKGKAYTFLHKSELDHLELIMKKTKSEVTFIEAPTAKDVKKAHVDSTLRMFQNALEQPNVYNELENAKVVLKQLGPELAVCAALVLLNPEIDGKDIVLSKEPKVSMKKAKSYKRSEPKSKKSSRGTSHKQGKKQEEKPKTKEEQPKVKEEKVAKEQPKVKKEEVKKEPKQKSLKERVLIELDKQPKVSKDSKGKKKASSPKGKKTTKASKNSKKKLADFKF